MGSAPSWVPARSGRRVGGLGSGLTCYSADAAGRLAKRPVGRVQALVAPTGGAVPVLPGLGKRPGFPVRWPAGACHPSTTKGMTLTMVETRVVTGGVDITLTPMSRPHWMTSAGCWGCRSSRRRRPGTRAYWPGWQASARCAWLGIEGTGRYGAGMARHITAAGIRVVEVDRSDRQDRRRKGKSDPLDAVSAARAGLRARRGAGTARWRRSGR
jgi:hypothetical protein